MIETQAIVERIERRIAELDAEIHLLTAARSALMLDSPTSESASAPPSRRNDEERRTRRPTRAATAEGMPTPEGNFEQSTDHEARDRQAGSKPPPRRRGSNSEPTRPPAEELEMLLAATDGLSTSALAKDTGGKTSQALTLLKELEHDGKIRRSGRRRATRWHWITDEQRVQTRATELKGLAKRPS